MVYKRLLQAITFYNGRLCTAHAGYGDKAGIKAQI